jgi:diguanylate cyclase (GGDEF)-like protein
VVDGERRDPFRALEGIYAYELWQRLGGIEDSLGALERGNLGSEEQRHLLQVVRSVASSASSLGLAELSRCAGVLAARLEGVSVIPGSPLEQKAGHSLRNAFAGLRRSVVQAEFLESLETSLTDAPRRAGKRKLLLLYGADAQKTSELSFQLGCFGFLVRSVVDSGELELSLPHASAVILDIDPESPDPDAESALQSVARHQEETADPPRFLLLCPSDTQELRIRAARLNADGFFARPVDLRVLIETLDLLLDQHTPAPYRALVVERHHELALEVSMALQSGGLEVTTIDDPADVLPRLPELEPEVIVVGLPPGASPAEELGAVLRQDRNFADLPIVFLYRQAALSERLDLVRRGGADLLVVPPVSKHLVSTVLHHADRYRTLCHFRSRDALTGLLNYSSAMEALWEEVRRSRERDARLVLALVEIDSLGEINRRLGFSAGDSVIVSLARLLQHRFRKTDILARFDNRFLLLLPNTSMANAANILDELKMVFAEVHHQTGGRSFAVTLSCGVAGLSASDEPYDLYQNARTALARAKVVGGNRVERMRP